MRFLDWNIGGLKSDPESISKAIMKYAGKGQWVATLQEVNAERFGKLQEVFGDIAELQHSFSYRAPGPYDDGGRELGIAIIAGGGLRIDYSGVFERSLLPERTLWARISDGEKRFTVASAHALTGCSHKRAKILQFLSLAEAIDEMRPDLLAFDEEDVRAIVDAALGVEGRLHGTGVQA